MVEKYEIEGYFQDENSKSIGKIHFKDMELFINIPSWIEARNIYDVATKEVKAQIKPQKFFGLTYRILDFDGEFAKIKTVDFGESLVKITEATIISNKPFYEKGCY